MDEMSPTTRNQVRLDFGGLSLSSLCLSASFQASAVHSVVKTRYQSFIFCYKFQLLCDHSGDVCFLVLGSGGPIKEMYNKCGEQGTLD